VENQERASGKCSDGKIPFLTDCCKSSRLFVCLSMLNKNHSHLGNFFTVWRTISSKGGFSGQANSVPYTHAFGQPLMLSCQLLTCHAALFSFMQHTSMHTYIHTHTRRRYTHMHNHNTNTHKQLRTHANRPRLHLARASCLLCCPPPLQDSAALQGGLRFCHFVF
jgi:hypothetical protein